MINRRIIASGLSIVSALAVMGGATFAFFSSSASSTANTFSTGSMELLLDDADELTPAPGVTASLSVAGLVPGDSSTGFISLHNGESVPIAEVELSANKTADDSDADMLEDVIDLTVKTGTNTTCTTGDTDRTATIAGAIGDLALPLTLGELIATPEYDALPGLAANGNAGDTYYLCVTSTLRSTAGDEYQGDSVTATVDFKANQNASQ